MNDRFQLSDKRILLVGSTGILGRGYAHALADCGAKLAIADRPQSDMLAYADVLGISGIEMDVTQEDEVVAGVKQAAGTLGGLDDAVMNAAATGEGLLADASSVCTGQNSIVDGGNTAW